MLGIHLSAPRGAKFCASDTHFIVVDTRIVTGLRPSEDFPIHQDGAHAAWRYRWNEQSQI